MNLNTVLRKRRMIRSFKPKPVEKEKIWRIIKKANRSPSAGHLEPQEFIIITDGEVKQRLGAAALNQMLIAEAPIVIVVGADSRRNVQRYGERGRRFYCTVDGAFASMLILLTAVDEEMGAVFIGAFDDEQVAKVLNLPGEVRPIGIIPIGYSDEPPEKVDRRPLEEKVHFNQWGNHSDTVKELREKM
jgi:nitroreductase